jgi:hypothetical protein
MDVLWLVATDDFVFHSDGHQSGRVLDAGLSPLKR